MRIQELIAIIATDKSNGSDTMTDELYAAVTGLANKLAATFSVEKAREVATKLGLAPELSIAFSVERSREVATKLGITWASGGPPLLAWAWTVWGAYHAGKITDLGKLLAEQTSPPTTSSVVVTVARDTV